MSKKLILPVTSAPAPDLATSTCVQCICFKPSAAAGQGNCRKKPPQAFMFLLPPNIAGGPPMDYNVGAWPVVRETDWCIDGFRAKKESVQ